MDKYTLSELCYQNGYKQGYLDALAMLDPKFPLDEVDYVNNFSTVDSNQHSMVDKAQLSFLTEPYESTCSL